MSCCSCIVRAREWSVSLGLLAVRKSKDMVSSCNRNRDSESSRPLGWGGKMGRIWSQMEKMGDPSKWFYVLWGNSKGGAREMEQETGTDNGIVTRGTKRWMAGKLQRK